MHGIESIVLWGRPDVFLILGEEMETGKLVSETKKLIRLIGETRRDLLITRLTQLGKEIRDHLSDSYPPSVIRATEICTGIRIEVFVLGPFPAERAIIYKLGEDPLRYSIAVGRPDAAYASPRNREIALTLRCELAKIITPWCDGDRLSWEDEKKYVKEREAFERSIPVSHFLNDVAILRRQVEHAKVDIAKAIGVGATSQRKTIVPEGGGTILVVEDEHDICVAIKFRLDKLVSDLKRPYEIQIMLAGTKLEAERKLQDLQQMKKELTLAWVDIVLPDDEYGGIHLMKWIRNESPWKTVPIIAVTAIGSVKMAARTILKAGADAVIAKPCVWADVRKTLKRFI